MCIFIFKILNNTLPEALRNRLQIIGSKSERRTRQAGNIVIEFRKTRNARKSVFYEGVKTYNSLPDRIKQCEIVALFERSLKEFILDEM